MYANKFSLSVKQDPNVPMDQYDDEVLQLETEHSNRMDDVSLEPTYAAISPVDQLERYGRWLSSIPRDDIIVLRETAEYQDFLRAFERLGHAHRRVVSMNRRSASMEEGTPNDFTRVPRNFVPQDIYMSFTNNFMQHLTADDVILRIFEFLECHSLIRMALTCSRFRQLAYRSAHQRTYDIANSRQLNSVMKLLRAKEQIDGVGYGINDSHVRVPILLLNRRVLVTNAGDTEMNGVYFCTGTNGNGFVFTKARFPEQRVQRTNNVQIEQGSSSRYGYPGVLLPVQQLPEREQRVIPFQGVGVDLGMGAAGPLPIDQGPSARYESEVAQPGQLLRCIIAKRFSGEVRSGYCCCFSSTNEFLMCQCPLALFLCSKVDTLVYEQGGCGDGACSRDTGWGSDGSLQVLGKAHVD